MSADLYLQGILAKQAVDTGPYSPVRSVQALVMPALRVLDMPDSLPKYSGYYPSQLAVGKMIMSGL